MKLKIALLALSITLGFSVAYPIYLEKDINAEVSTTNTNYASRPLEEAILSQSNIAVDKIEIDTIELNVAGKTKVNVLEEASYLFTITNSGRTEISNLKFVSIYDDSRLKMSDDGGLNIFFDNTQLANGKQSFSHTNLSNIIGPIAPGESKSFNINFIAMRSASPTCIDTTIDYSPDELNITGTASTQFCTTIIEASLNTDF